MSKYRSIQLTNPMDKDIAEVLNLFRGIPGRTCTASAYLKYLHLNWANVGLFVVYKDDEIVAFTQSESPGILDPKAAWLPFSHRGTGCPRKEAEAIVKLAEEWMVQLGATHWKMTTTRNVAAMERSWGIKRSKEVLMEKEL